MEEFLMQDFQSIWIDDPLSKDSLSNPVNIKAIDSITLPEILAKLQESVDEARNVLCEPAIKSTNSDFPTGIFPINNRDVVGVDGQIKWCVSWKDMTYGDIKRTWPDRCQIIYFFRGTYGEKEGYVPIGEFLEFIKNTAKEAGPFLSIVLALRTTVNILIDILGSIFKSKKVNPVRFTKYILSQDVWNLYDLSMKLGIDKEKTQKLLKGLGYKYSKSKQSYILGKYWNFGRRLKKKLI